MTAPLDELRFILETRRLNKAAAERAFAGRVRSLRGPHAALRARAAGDGRQHLLADTLLHLRGLRRPHGRGDDPRDEQLGKRQPGHRRDAARGGLRRGDRTPTEEQTIRALALSHLTVIYIKQSLGRLSALVRLRGGGHGIELRHHLPDGRRLRARSAAAVKNMIANLTGMICDGAKPSCSMKLTSGVSTAVLSAMMAMDGHCVTPGRGNHRGGCRQVHPQPHGHRPRRHERDRPARAGNHDA